MIEIDIKATGLKSIQKKLGRLENNAPSVLVRAINRAAVTAKTSMKKQSSGIPSIYRVKPSEVEKRIRIKKANSEKLYAVVTVKGYVKPLIHFSLSPKRVVSYKGKNPNPKRYKAAVKKGHSMVPLDSSDNKPFVAITTKDKFTGLFSRMGKNNTIIRNITITRKTQKKGRRVYKFYKYKRKAEKLQMHFGPSIPQMAANNIIYINIEEDTGKTLNTRVNHEINRLLRRL